MVYRIIVENISCPQERPSSALEKETAGVSTEDVEKAIENALKTNPEFMKQYSTGPMHKHALGLAHLIGVQLSRALTVKGRWFAPVGEVSFLSM